MIMREVVSDEGLCHNVPKIGAIVDIDGDRGTIRYFGEVKGTKGYWVGIEWLNPERGKHNGTYGGIHYFSTRHPTSGSFVRPQRVNSGQSFRDAILKRYGEQEVIILPEEDRKISQSFDKVIEFVGAEKMTKKISQLGNLTMVSLKNMQIYGTGKNDNLEALVPNLTELDLSFNLISSWEAVATIVKQLPSLRSLILDDNSLIIPNNPEEFVDVFKNLKTLILNRLNYTWNDVLMCSTMWPNLESLVLSGNNIIELGQGTLHNLYRLKSLDLSCNPIEYWESIMKLQQLPKLRKLNLMNCNISSINFDNCQPGSMIQKFHAVEKLNLTHNKLESWLDIAELAKLPNLRKLKVLGNPVMNLENWESCRQLVIAKMESLEDLDGVFISKQERRGAELDYLKRYHKDIRSLSVNRDSQNKQNETLEFARLHPTYAKLLKVYGAVDENQASVKNVTKFSLLNLVITCPRIPEKSSFTKKIPATMTVGKLKATVHRLFKVDVGDLKLSYSTSKEDGRFFSLDNDLQTLSFFELKDGDIITVEW